MEYTLKGNVYNWAHKMKYTLGLRLGSKTIIEYQRATELVIKLIQQQIFSEEIKLSPKLKYSLHLEPHFEEWSSSCWWKSEKLLSQSRSETSCHSAKKNSHYHAKIHHQVQC